MSQFSVWMTIQATSCFCNVIIIIRWFSNDFYNKLFIKIHINNATCKHNSFTFSWALSIHILMFNFNKPFENDDNSCPMITVCGLEWKMYTGSTQFGHGRQNGTPLFMHFWSAKYSFLKEKSHVKISFKILHIYFKLWVSSCSACVCHVFPHFLCIQMG